MTREEAIEILEYHKAECEEDYYVVRVEALDMAIKALKQEPCDDAISKQAVLDGIEELKKSPWATDKRGNGFEYLITEALDVVADLCVKKELSVTPQEPKITNYYTNEKRQRIQVDYDIYDTARITRELLEILLEANGFRKCGEESGVGNELNAGPEEKN